MKPFVKSREVVAQQIRDRLRMAGQSQRALAQHMHRTPTTLSNKLDGQRPFTTDELDAIAEFFDIEVKELFARRTIAMVAA